MNTDAGVRRRARQGTGKRRTSIHHFEQPSVREPKQPKQLPPVEPKPLYVDRERAQQ